MLYTGLYFGISIHALREEGDQQDTSRSLAGIQFLSTPSARRATGIALFLSGALDISIHALREEGDLACRWTRWPHTSFLSTPSARRATTAPIVSTSGQAVFLSTPSARRATAL